MNKYKQLIQQTVRQAIIAGVAVLVAVGAYVGVTVLEDSVLEQQKEAEKKFNDNKNLLSDLRGQMDKSGDAEKRYLALMEKRGGDTPEDFSGKLETFKGWLGNTFNFYHLRMTDKGSQVENEMETEKPELKNLQGYAVVVRPKLSLDLDAVTDMHIFSFIQEMQRSAPGFVRVDSLEVKRNGDMNEGVISGFRSGSPQQLVHATLELSIIGVRPREKTATTEAAKQ